MKHSIEGETNRVLSVKIIDNQFPHAPTAGNGNLEAVSSKLEWYRGDEYRDITVFTDRSLEEVDHSDSKYKIAWLLESPSTLPKARKLIRKINRKFDLVLTFEDDLLKRGQNFVHCSMGGTWIERQDQQVYAKSRNVSIIASRKSKNKGQALRHDIVSTFGEQLDLVCGRGYKPIDYKLEALKDYRYSVVAENSDKDSYFSEKLIDCFVTGVIPIFWGCPGIGRYFNTKGMIVFRKLKELDFRLYDEAFYQSRIEFVRENFEKAQAYSCLEDTVCECIQKHLPR